MVFGVFDRLHDGHRAFFKQAGQYGYELIAVVARDVAVFQLKNKKPFQNERSRLAFVQRVRSVAHAALGDLKSGTYDIIRRWEPDIICLGYDQKSLERDLKKRIREGGFEPVRLIRLRSFQPRRFHTSILQKKWYTKNDG